jgi:Trk K+ transport system NAD-binding subunit
MASARGLLAVTDSDWVNLEIALLARTLNPECALVLRTESTRLTENLAGLTHGLRVLCVPVIAAKAFAAAALGESVLDLFQLGERTVFVIEYAVAAGDRLAGALLADVAEAYSVVPVLHERAGSGAHFCSVDDRGVRLEAGDRLVLLGPSKSLRRIELAEMRERTVTLTITSMRGGADRAAVARVVARELGGSNEAARDLLEKLPAAWPEHLYPHHADRARGMLETAGAQVDVATSEKA